MQSGRFARSEFWRGWEGPHVTGRFKLRGQRRCVATGWQNRGGRIQPDENEEWSRICTGAIPRHIVRNANTNTDCDPEYNTQPERDGNINANTYCYVHADSIGYANAYGDSHRDGNTTSDPDAAV
jgi:hypothetical protein